LNKAIVLIGCGGEFNLSALGKFGQALFAAKDSVGRTGDDAVACALGLEGQPVGFVQCLQGGIDLDAGFGESAGDGNAGDFEGGFNAFGCGRGLGGAKRGNGPGDMRRRHRSTAQRGIGADRDR